MGESRAGGRAALIHEAAVTGLQGIMECTLSSGLPICATPVGAGPPGSSAGTWESPPVLGQMCEISRPSGCLTTGNGICPWPSWGPGLPSLGKPGVSALHSAGVQGCSSRQEPSCLCSSPAAAAVAQARLESDKNLTSGPSQSTLDATCQEAGGTKIEKTKPFPHGAYSLGIRKET